MRTTTRLGAAAISAALATTAFASVAAAQDVEGTLDVHGSSTVEPISSLVSFRFNEINPGFGFVVGGEGTGDGFAQFFCPDVSDVSDASRPIKDDPEAIACEANGVTWTELKIGYDGMAVLTNPANPLECVNFNDLYAIFGPESNDISTYEDATAFAAELGSSTDLGSGRISITAPGTESGTYDSFAEIVLEDIKKEREVESESETRDPVPPYWIGAANDRVIVEGIGFAPSTAYGFVGLAFAEEAGDSVKTLAVDGGDGNCVLPSAETVSDGTYPISRPLFIYPALNRLESNPTLVPWVDYYLGDGYSAVTDANYVALPEAELAATREQWEDAKAGGAVNERTRAVAE